MKAEEEFVTSARRFLARCDAAEKQKVRTKVPTASGDPAESLACLNCASALPPPPIKSMLYCQTSCSDAAEFVRYVRRCRSDGRVDRPDILEAIGVQLVMAYSGGYPRSERRLTGGQRSAILDRDGKMCRLCGAPATEIDHIAGDSDDPSNLRALCRACNLREAARHLTTVDDLEERTRVEATVADLASRVASNPPRSPCDDEVNWPKIYRSISAKRRRLLTDGSR
jgi:hypothetical protein